QGGLWVTDGTAVGTHEITGITGAYTGGLNPQNIIAFNNGLLFEGLDPNLSETLWVSDGTGAGTHQATGIIGASTARGMSPTDPIVFNGKVYFAGFGSSNAFGLWVTDGSTGGTHEITGISGASANGLFSGLGNIPFFTLLNGELMFEGFDS